MCKRFGEKIKKFLRDRSFEPAAEDVYVSGTMLYCESQRDFM